MDFWTISILILGLIAAGLVVTYMIVSRRRAAVIATQPVMPVRANYNDDNAFNTAMDNYRSTMVLWERQQQTTANAQQTTTSATTPPRPWAWYVAISRFFFWLGGASLSYYDKIRGSDRNKRIAMGFALFIIPTASGMIFGTEMGEILFESRTAGLFIGLVYTMIIIGVDRLFFQQKDDLDIAGEKIGWRFIALRLVVNIGFMGLAALLLSLFIYRKEIKEEIRDRMEAVASLLQAEQNSRDSIANLKVLALQKTLEDHDYRKTQRQKLQLIAELENEKANASRDAAKEEQGHLSKRGKGRGDATLALERFHKRIDEDIADVRAALAALDSSYLKVTYDDFAAVVEAEVGKINNAIAADQARTAEKIARARDLKNHNGLLNRISAFFGIMSWSVDGLLPLLLLLALVGLDCLPVLIKVRMKPDSYVNLCRENAQLDAAELASTLGVKTTDKNLVYTLALDKNRIGAMNSQMDVIEKQTALNAAYAKMMTEQAEAQMAAFKAWLKMRSDFIETLEAAGLTQAEFDAAVTQIGGITPPPMLLGSGSGNT